MSTAIAPAPLPPRFAPEDVIDHPSGYLALSPRNRRFQVPEVGGFIAYREQGMHLVAFGGVHAAPADRPLLLDRFLDKARRRHRRVLAVQVREDQVTLFHERGFVVNRFGATYGVRIPGFSYAGKLRMKVRQKVKQARTAGMRVMELGREWPIDHDTVVRIERVSADWLRAKGKKELDFMVGELGRLGDATQPSDAARRVFVVTSAAGNVEGFITYVPVWGERPGYLHDLTRRTPQAPVGAMELCNAVALERFAAEGAEYLHFGFTPFVMDGDDGPAASPLLARLLRLLWEYGDRIYPARSQAAYKLKWAPDFVEPEYVAAKPLSPRAIWDLLRLTRSI
jgi:lysylphosphatidylglycerol synthetase-like protein (DUF2156 family)